ncbi:Uncharacterised protein [Mycobacteroides abscessus subsp. abscessus]|nr:Uncharacterised protein [Mycobacteroides abscessus subsp. abscessus]
MDVSVSQFTKSTGCRDVDREPSQQTHGGFGSTAGRIGPGEEMSSHLMPGSFDGSNGGSG